MTIKFKEFTLQPGPNAKDRFDLLRTKEVTMNNTPMMKSKYPKAKQGDIVGTKEEELGLDMLLENAIEKCIKYLLADKEEVTDLKGYINAYKSERLELERLLKP